MMLRLSAVAVPEQRSDFMPPLCGAFVGLSALALVLPNHSPPWMSFLQETLAALAMTLLAIGVLATQRRAVPWRMPELVTFGLLIVITVQAACGLIGFVQTAWMHALYLLGLLLALQTGAALERRAPGRALALLLSSAMLAAGVSFGLQLYQWLGLASGEVSTWVFRSIGGRPAGNLGQPNLLASVDVIALLGVFWLWRARRWPAGLALAMAIVPVVGLALTQSRTGLLNAWLVIAALLAWHWQDRVLRRALPLIALAMLGLFAAYSLFGVPADPAHGAALAAERLSAGLRPDAWRLFAGALLERPLTGYGWGQTFAAQLAAAPDRPPLHRVFLSAHNLLLDLLLWNGLPVALGAIGLAGGWFVQCARRAADEPARLLLLVMAVPALHSMFEFPLEYAYFLLPAGLAAGALGERVELATVLRLPRWLMPGLLLLALAAAALTVRDYLRVEHSYRQLLLEKAHIVVTDDLEPPQVRVLDSLRDLIVYSRLEPAPGMAEGELQRMAQLMQAHPGAYGFAKLARALALNGQVSEAQHWVDQLCRTFLAAQCREQAALWSEQAQRAAPLAAVRWP